MFRSITFFKGDPNAESNVLPFCLRTDLDLVAYNMEVYPLCSYLRFLAIEKGFGEVQVEDHQLKQKYHPDPRYFNRVSCSPCF